jgi:hypothetical protein
MGAAGGGRPVAETWEVVAGCCSSSSASMRMHDAVVAHSDSSSSSSSSKVAGPLCPAGAIWCVVNMHRWAV